VTTLPARTYEYIVFSRPVQSELRLSALRPRPVDGPPAVGPSIRVRRGTIPDRPNDVAESITRVYRDPDRSFTIYQARDRETCYWFYDGVGTLRISDGTDVTLWQAPTGSDAAARRLVRGPGIRTALIQQGCVVLHASAVVVDGAAVAFAGPSGRGKSTTAGAFVAAGHDLLTDDVLPCPADGFDGRPTVHPGAPGLSLDDRSADALGLADESGPQGTVIVDGRFADSPTSLGAVYLLTDGDHVDVTELGTQEAVFDLLQSSYALYDESDASAQQRHLDACGRLSRAIDVSQLTRPRSLSCLDELVAAVRADLHDSAAE